MNIETAQKLDSLLEQITIYRETRKDPRCSVPKNLRNEIIAFLPVSGMNKWTLGRKLGLTPSTLYRWVESAKSNPTPPREPRIIKASKPKAKAKDKLTTSLDYNVMSAQTEEVILKAVQERKVRAADGDTYSRVRKNLNAYRSGHDPINAIASAIGDLVLQLQHELETNSESIHATKRITSLR